MKTEFEKNGSVLIVVVFAIALLTAFVAGMLQLNAEQIQLMKNEIFSAQAIAIAEAGLADAFSRIRSSPAWPTSFSNSFGGGSYTVTVTGTPPNRCYLGRHLAAGFRCQSGSGNYHRRHKPSRICDTD